MVVLINKNKSEHTEEEKKILDQVGQIEFQAMDLLVEMDLIVAIDERSQRGRCMNIARTKLEEAVLWAEKAIVTPPEKNG